jgi:hypothetical protein
MAQKSAVLTKRLVLLKTAVIYWPVLRSPVDLKEVTVL